ncbi:hypothetical protein JCM1393_06140 [Clostridium carnis]
MSKEIIFNSIYFNIFILFINTSVSDILYKTFFIPPSLISIARLISNFIFILMVIYYLLTKRIKMKRYALSAVFIIFVGITLIWAPEKFEGIKLYINLLGPCCYFLLLFCISSKERIIKILKSYCSVLVITDILALAIFTKVGYMGEGGSTHVARGIHLSRSTMIIYLNFCIFIYMYSLSIIKSKSLVERRNTIIMLILSIVLIVISKSSTGIVTMSLFIPLIFIVKSKRVSKIALKSAMVVGIALPIMNISSPIINKVIVSVFGKTLTFSGRRYIWDYALQKLTSNPFRGNGFNSTTYLLKGRVIPIYERIASHTHNGFLELFLQSGLIGLILIISIIIIVFKYTFKLEKNEANIIRIYFIIFIIFNFMEPYLINSVSVITLWLPVIYVISITNKEMREKIIE